jgi:hypothetical protein
MTVGFFIKTMLGISEDGESRNKRFTVTSMMITYLGTEVPYHVKQMKDLLKVLEKLGLQLGGLPQTVDFVDNRRGALYDSVKALEKLTVVDEAQEDYVMKQLLELIDKIDELSKEVDRTTHNYLLGLVNNSKVSAELRRAFLDGDDEPLL